MNQTKSAKETPKLFVLAVAAFLLDRILPLFFDFPIIFFVALIFIFIINSDKDRLLVPIIISAVIIDIFSGFYMGVVILSIALMFVFINFIKNYVDLKRGGILGEVVFVLFFIFILDIIKVRINSYFVHAGQFYSDSLFFIPTLDVIIALVFQVALMSWAFSRKWFQPKRNYD